MSLSFRGNGATPLAVIETPKVKLAVHSSGSGKNRSLRSVDDGKGLAV
jgi:hypothetical protein